MTSLLETALFVAIARMCARCMFTPRSCRDCREHSLIERAYMTWFSVCRLSFGMSLTEYRDWYRSLGAA